MAEKEKGKGSSSIFSSVTKDLKKEIKGLKRDKDRLAYYWQNIAEKRSLKGSSSGFQPREVDPESQLCAVCKDVDVKALMQTWQPDVELSRFTGAGRFPGRRVALGALDEILGTQCLLCKMVAQAVLEAWQMDAQDLLGYHQAGTPLMCYLGTQYVSLDNANNKQLDAQRGGYVLRHPTMKGPGVLYVEVESTDTSEVFETFKEIGRFYKKILMPNDSKPKVASDDVYRQVYQPQLRLLVDDAPLLSLPTFGLGILPASVDFDRLRSWYDTCVAHHQCGSSNAHIPGMRLIDTTEMNIKAAPESDISYVALSYVWGTAKQLTALESNYHDFEIENSLTQQQLPQTIADAIQVTKNIGIRYLWVDALCIIQDSKTQKQSQIESMDKIYTGATITIVAAAGNHANYGLAGVRPRETTVSMETIQGLRLMVPPADIGSEMTRSIWFTRAWCYQEWKLSRRLLFFSPHQVYFVCQAANFCESIDVSMPSGELNNAPQSVGIEINSLWNKWSWPTFKNRMHEYTTRSLSFESDVLNACLGVLSSMEINVKDNFVAGVPRGELLRGMLWQPARSIKRRSYTNFPFPSWSWMGWVGPANFESWSHWSEVVVQEWFYRDTRGLHSLGKGATRKVPTETNHGFYMGRLAQPKPGDDFDDAVYESELNQEPALKDSNGCELPNAERFTPSPEDKESLQASAVVLVPSQNDPRLLEYALASSLSDEEKATAWSPSHSYGILASEAIQENGVLQFYTETARLTITSDTNYPLPRQTEAVSVYEPFPADPSLRFFRIIDPKQKNQWIGSVQLPASFFDDKDSDTLEYEFVLLSATKLRRRGWEEEPHTHYTSFFVDRRSISYLWDEGKWYTLGLNVAMIERRRGVAYRVALGKVHYVAWETAGIEKKVITLG